MSVCFNLYRLSSNSDLYMNYSKQKDLPKSMKRSLNRQYKKLETFAYSYKEITPGHITRSIQIEPVVYRQGWFLKKRFFKKPYTEIVCTSKSAMESFFRKYIDCKSEDKRGIECVNTMRDAWKDGMIFICSW